MAVLIVATRCIFFFRFLRHLRSSYATSAICRIADTNEDVKPITAHCMQHVHCADARQLCPYATDSDITQYAVHNDSENSQRSSIFRSVNLVRECSILAMPLSRVESSKCVFAEHSNRVRQRFDRNFGATILHLHIFHRRKRGKGEESILCVCMCVCLHSAVRRTLHTAHSTSSSSSHNCRLLWLVYFCFQSFCIIIVAIIGHKNGCTVRELRLAHTPLWVDLILCKTINKYMFFISFVSFVSFIFIYVRMGAFDHCAT